MNGPLSLHLASVGWGHRIPICYGHLAETRGDWIAEGPRQAKQRFPAFIAAVLGPVPFQSPRRSCLAVDMRTHPWLRTNHLADGTLLARPSGLIQNAGFPISAECYMPLRTLSDLEYRFNSRILLSKRPSYALMMVHEVVSER